MPNYSHGTKVSVASNEEPPYLTVGTDVSAKYKGAFCEAKITDVNKHVKLRVLFDGSSGSYLIDDTEIKEGSTLETGTKIEAKHPGKRQQTYVPATITKILDHSRYTVVFDDGDQCVLRRNSICLKSGKHFAESETLDQLPLTNPEHFGNPVKVGALELQHNNHHAQQQTQNNNTTNNSGTVNNNNNNGTNHHSNSNSSSKISRGKAATATTTATTSTNNTTTTATNSTTPNTAQNPSGRRGAKGRKRRESVNNGSKHAPEPDDDSVEDSQDSIDADLGESAIKYESIEIGVKLMVRYGKGKVQNVYEAKVNKIETNSAGKTRYFVHYTGWNNRYDEWVTKNRIVSIVTEKQGRETKQSKTRATDAPSSNNSTTAANSTNSTASTTTAPAGKSPPTIVPAPTNEEPPVKTRRSKHADLNEGSTQIVPAVATVPPTTSSVASATASSNINELPKPDKETTTKSHRETTTKSHRPRHSETTETITVASSTTVSATVSVAKSPPTIVSAPSNEEPPTKTRRSKNVDINESSTQVTPAVTSASSSASSISSITSTTASSSNNESSKSDKEPVTRSYRSRHAETIESTVTACSTSTTSAAKSPPTHAPAPPIEEPPVKTRRSKQVDINESSTQITPAVTPASSSASSISSITSTTVSSNNNDSSKSDKETLTKSHKSRQLETNEFNSSSPSSRPSYSFCTDINEPDCDKKISILQARIMALRQTYMSLKSELNDLDRRRKRPRTDRTSSSEHIKMENFV